MAEQADVDVKHSFGYAQENPMDLGVLRNRPGACGIFNYSTGVTSLSPFNLVKESNKRSCLCVFYPPGGISSKSITPYGFKSYRHDMTLPEAPRYLQDGHYRLQVYLHNDFQQVNEMTRYVIPESIVRRWVELEEFLPGKRYWNAICPFDPEAYYFSLNFNGKGVYRISIYLESHSEVWTYHLPLLKLVTTGTHQILKCPNLFRQTATIFHHVKLQKDSMGPYHDYRDSDADFRLITGEPFWPSVLEVVD